MNAVATAPQGATIGSGAGVDASSLFDHEAAIEACARGERFALQALFEHEARFMLALAVRTVRDPDLAQQALCDGLTQVWLQAATYRRAQCPGRAWVMARVRQRAQALANQARRSDVAWPDAWLDAGASWAEVLAPDTPEAVWGQGLRVPQALWHLVCRQLGPGGQPAPGGDAVTGWWRTGALRVGGSLLAMLCFGLGLLLAWGALTQEPGASGEPVRYMAVLSSPQEQATWVLVGTQGGPLRLTPLSTQTPVGPGQRLVLWVRDATALRPHALGQVSPDRATEWAAGRMPALQAGQAFELTVEPSGALEALAPAGAVVAQGALDRL